MEWEPIKDLPNDWQNLVSTEIESLAQAWFEAYETLKDTPMLNIFNERLRREWSIETGIIERIYSIDRGTTQLLVEQGIDSALISHGSTDIPPVEVVRIIKAQREALDGIFAFVANKEELSLHFIRSLHQVLLKHQDYTEGRDQFGNPINILLVKGEWKREPNNPTRTDSIIHEYCPPEQVQSQMEYLLKLHKEHMNNDVSPEIEAAWLHHRFTQIHPFQDGNGRVARCLATMVLLRYNRFPLVINRDQRLEYIIALEEADKGDITKLVKLFDHIQKRSFIQALDLSEDVLPTSTSIGKVVDALTETYRKRKKDKYERVFDVALMLHETSKEAMLQITNSIRQNFYQLGLLIDVRTLASNPENSNWYSQDIIKIANKIGYFANLSRPRLWTRLKFKDEDNVASTDAEIVLSIHYLGKENRGVMIATVFLNILHTISSSFDESDESIPTRPFRETYPLISDGFIFAFTDANLSVRRKEDFRDWLEQAIAVGLAEWQKQL